jgi:prepilin-type N-terminal cleavage/methylation domain-containing protein
MRPPSHTRPPAHRPDIGGFTLLEVMIAVAIMATIMAVLFTTYSAAVERATRTRELSHMYHEARVLLELMAHDLRTAYVKESVEQAQQTLQQARAPVYKSKFVGADLTEADQPRDTLVFSAILPTARRDTPETEMCQLTYTLEPVADSPQGRMLARRVNCSLDPEATAQDHLYLLTELARGLDFKYYDDRGIEYVKWDSQAPPSGKRLPARVKIMVLLVDQHEQVRPFEMSTELVLSKR